MGGKYVFDRAVCSDLAKGSTALSFAVASSEATTAHRAAPPSDPANRWFLRLCRGLHNRNYVEPTIMRSPPRFSRGFPSQTKAQRAA